MADAIQVAYSVTAASVYTVIRNTAGQAYRADSQVFEAYSTANLTSTKYAIAMTEQGTASRYYSVAFPSAIATGLYFATIYLQGGAAPAETDTLLAGGSVEWDGSAFVPLATRLATTGYTVPPTAAAVATAVWTDTTGSDFTTTSSPGKILVTQLGGTFTTTSSSVFTVGALANGPTGGTAPTTAQIATAVWTDTTAGDFATAGSIGKSLFTSGAVPGAAGGLFIAGSNAATTISGLTTGALSCSTITASGAVAFQSTFAVTTSTSLAALSATTVTFSGAVALQSTFAVTGTTTLTGAVSLGSTLGVTGTVTFNAFTITNNMLVSGTTTHTGAVSHGSTFGVTGATTLGGLMTGALSCTTITASGAVAFQSTFAVTGTTTLTGAVSLGSTLGVTGTTTLNALTITNALTVSGATTLTGAVTGINASNDLRVNLATWLGVAPLALSSQKVQAVATVSGTVDANILSVNGTTFAGANVPADLQTIKTQTVTCGAGVTILASVGTAATSTAQTGDAYAKVSAITFTVAGFVDVNVQYVNDVIVKGTGTTLDPWNPGP